MYLNTPLRKCWALAWPVSLQSVVAAMMGMIDVVMVGHLGSTAVAAVGIASRAQFVVLMVLTAVGVSASVLGSQYIGAKRAGVLPSLFYKSVGLGMLIGAPLIAMICVFARPLLSLGSDDTGVITSGSAYLQVALPSMLATVIVLVIEGILRAKGVVKLPLAAGVLAMLINVLLNYLLISGNGGFPALGIIGAAWATVVARVVQLGLLAGYLMRSTPSGQGQLHGPAGSVPMATLFRLTGPVALNFFVWSLGTFVYQLIFAAMGTDALAVISMLAPVEGAVISLFTGFASATAVLVGRELGAGAFAQAYQMGWRFSLLVSGIAVFVGFCVWLGQQWVLSPYRGTHSETLAMASHILTVMAVGVGFKTLNMMLSLGMLRAGGDNRYNLSADMICMWCIGIPVTYWVAGSGATLVWVYMATFSEEFGKNLLFGGRALTRRWVRNLTQSGQGQPATA